MMNTELLGLTGITGRFVGASDDYISRLETAIGFSLPTNYVHFLRRYGASFFEKNVCFSSLDPSPWAEAGKEGFDAFYGASEQPQFDLIEVRGELIGEISFGALAIGYDAFANQIVLKKDGSVWFFDRERGKEHLCSKDFQSFLDSFEADPEIE